MMSKLEKMARDSMAAWNAHDVDKIVSLEADDAVNEVVPTGEVYHGRTEYGDYLRNTFAAFPDFKVDLKSVIASGERAVLEWVITGTFKGVLQPLGLQPTGKSFTVRGTTVTEAQGGRFKHSTDYWDSATMFQQIGITPSAP